MISNKHLKEHKNTHVSHLLFALYMDAKDFLYVCTSSQMSTTVSPPFETPPGRAFAPAPGRRCGSGRRLAKRSEISGASSKACHWEHPLQIHWNQIISISPDFPRIGSEKMHETPYLIRYPKCSMNMRTNICHKIGQM